MPVKNIFVILYTVCFIFSCSKDSGTDSNAEPYRTEQGEGIPVYNQAYQENYETDTITEIISKARNSYVLLDPFVPGVPEQIAAIKANGNEVGAYISIGTGENFRDDFEEMKPYLVSLNWEEWPKEFFVDATNTGVLEVMKSRIDKISAWGCDWVEFDNMDWIYDNASRNRYGFKVTEEEGVAYFQALCSYVQEKGMKCMAKNTTKDASNFDGVLYESYKNNKNWWDQSGTQSFLDAGKLVIINHYNETACAAVYSEYKGIYNSNLSFICENVNLKKYVHFVKD